MIEPTMDLIRSKRIQNACIACSMLQPSGREFTLSMLSTLHRPDERLEDGLERVWDTISTNMMGGEL